MATDKPALLVQYLAVGRLHPDNASDNSIVASYASIDDVQDVSVYAGWFRTLMSDFNGPLRANNGARFHKVMTGDDDATKNGLHVNFLASPIDEKNPTLMVYFAVCSAAYNERTPLNGAAQLLWEMRANLSSIRTGGGLARAHESGDFQTAAQPVFESLCWLHGIDKFQAIDDSLAKVKEQMHQNITVTLANVEQLSEMEEKARDMAAFAEGWDLATKKVAQQMWWKKWKTQLILIAVVIVLLVVIIAPIASAAATGDDTASEH